jgi:serine/threonine-protein kinase
MWSVVSSVSLRIDPGTTVGPYVVERRLAQGGMSVLFLARENSTGREVVLKVLPDELATPTMRARLSREARALASVDHPGIVRIYGTGEHDGSPWIAMEYVRGSDLKRLIADRGAVSTQKALRWTVQIAEALAAAHDAGVIHRDLKPSNLLFTHDEHHDEQIKIVDFGIAKRRTEPATPGDVLTQKREVIGTPAYLSPEQLEHGLADERSDIWALGCVLYELCAGTPPFGRSGSASTMASILRDEPELPPHMRGPVGAVITSCLRKSSFARVGSARELAALARDALGSSTSVAPDAGEPRAGSEGAIRSSSPAVPNSYFPPSDRRASTPPSSFPPGSLRAGTSQRPGSSGTRFSQTRGRIKGTAIRAGLTWYGATFGPGALRSVYERASSELRAVLRLEDASFGIIASAWYSVPAIGELLELLEKVSGTEDEGAYRSALSAAIARDNVSGVYRSLFRLIATPPLLEANIQRVWRTYLDDGVARGVAPKLGELALHIGEWEFHHPKVCETVGYFAQHALREVGYRAAVVDRVACVTEGASECVFETLYLP